MQAYAARATLEMLEGLNLLVRNARMGGFSLPSTVSEGEGLTLHRAFNGESETSPPWEWISQIIRIGCI